MDSLQDGLYQLDLLILLPDCVQVVLTANQMLVLLVICYPPITAHLATILMLWTNQKLSIVAS